MRLFFIEWSGKQFGLDAVVKTLQDQGHQIVYWSGFELDNNVNKAQFPETIFHDYYDARAARPAEGVDVSQFAPPSDNLIRQMLQTESDLLIQMNKSFEWMRENQKKHLYYQYLRYWDGVFKKFKPDAIICPSAPHTVYDLVVYGLAKLYNVKTIIFELTSVFDRSIVMSDYRVGCEALRQQLAADAGHNFTVADLLPDVKRYYDKQMNPDKFFTPPIVSQTLSRYSPAKTLQLKAKGVFNSFKDGSFWEWAGRRLTRLRDGNMKSEYLSLQKTPDFNAPYIYFPLHYQPECTTSPLGGVFVDMLLSLEILSAALGPGMKIYVKEHPFQWKPRGTGFFSYRYKGFYKAIAALPNVELVPLDTPSSVLIKNATAMATVGGTSPWEGVFRGKPGIAFGYPWYQHCPGIHLVRDLESCKKAVAQIIAGESVDPQKVINYLGSFQKVVLEAYRDDYDKSVSSITLEENIKNHVAMILRELNA